MAGAARLAVGLRRAGGGQQPPSLFIVGDPKQSIYRFRRAEPQVFQAAQAFVRDAFGGDLLACDHTRRNALGVITTVNSAMQAAQGQQEYSGFREHTTESRTPGCCCACRRLPRPMLRRMGMMQAMEGPPALARQPDRAAPRGRVETLRMQESAQAARWVAAQMAAGIPAGRDHGAGTPARTPGAHGGSPARAASLRAARKADLAAAPEVQDMVALLDVLVSPRTTLAAARQSRRCLAAMTRCSPSWRCCAARTNAQATAAGLICYKTRAVGA